MHHEASVVRRCVTECPHLGWVDADGNGDWAIALRCARLNGDRATLYAGAGIVGASDPAAELEETERKFGAFLDALRWG